MALSLQALNESCDFYPVTSFNSTHLNRGSILFLCILTGSKADWPNNDPTTVWATPFDLPSMHRSESVGDYGGDDTNKRPLFKFCASIIRGLCE
jgi:hypothetical protein